MAEYEERELLIAPDGLAANGQFNFGTFKSQFRKANPLKASEALSGRSSSPL